MQLHVIWGHASARQLKRVLVGSDGGDYRLVNYADEASEPCEVCMALDKVSHVPIAGTSTVSMFNEKAQVDLLFLGDIT